MKPVLIIDPGHGGKDPGGGSNKYWVEKDLNLTISLYQFQRYQQLGIPVAITRQKDVTLSPAERTKIVRESGAKYCHSNHINAGGGDGGEVIHSIYGGEDMAEEVAAELQHAGQNIRRIFTRPLPNDCTRDFYYMNRDTGAVITNIIEYGFADSRGDDIRQIKDDWQVLAESVVKAFCSYVEFPYESIRGGVTLKKYLSLPPEASTWRIYPLNASPVKGNEKGFLRPEKFGGLTYQILGTPQAHVYLIQTRDFGKVQIYGHPNTGAKVLTK
ncbi:N-acetylmuramoyl-L-alanine amidase [Virgibacillus subterraneus]|uniref:N-acetylmuramoyl-L-alanine amidase n=1 Tax=Virgibacillus subterraneus TaxID=621109 RepID=A0A1H9HQB2_9BACI|nr:N-acetylmuramoyl-L-alanine amidase [Virgibacillus subterraneus]SEQ64505.1 N-acetylmuramoyl-L-alanine amidase [Virgibacillus subterraneus]